MGWNFQFSYKDAETGKIIDSPKDPVYVELSNGNINAKIRKVLGVRPRQSKLTKALPRYKSGIRIPTRVVLEKYAAALGKHIELRINDEE